MWDDKANRGGDIAAPSETGSAMTTSSYPFSMGDWEMVTNDGTRSIPEDVLKSVGPHAHENSQRLRHPDEDSPEVIECDPRFAPGNTPQPPGQDADDPLEGVSCVPVRADITHPERRDWGPL